MNPSIFYWIPLLGIGLFSGCGGKSEPGSDGTASALNTPVRVQAQKVESKERIMTEEVVGTVRSKIRAMLEAKIAGRIDQLPAAAGQKVRQGEKLAQLEAGEIQARLEQAKAQWEQAARDLKRYEVLIGRDSVTRQEFDAVQARERVIKAAVSEAESSLANATIVAPFDGVVTRKFAEVGDLATPGKPLLEIEDPAHLRFEIDAPEAVLAKMSYGDTLEVIVDALRKPIQGKVGEMAPSADPISRTFHVKIDLPEVEGLRSGQFGRASIPIGQTNSLRAPVSAIFQRGQLEMVFVVTNGKAQLRIVKTGKRLESEIELISGVSDGESVVLSPTPSLLDGQSVSLQP